MLKGHGDDLYQYQSPIKYNFSSNVYFGGINNELLLHLKGKINRISNYPSPNAEELTQLTAKHLGVDSQQILFTNGATEAFYLIAQHFKHQNSCIIIPSFAEYEDAATAHDLHIKYIEGSDFLEYSFTEALVFFGNPNNPDGKTYQVCDIENILDRFPKSTFVLDEAYIEFTNVVTTGIPLTRKYPNLIIVRSLTKTFVIPGLRLGYIVSTNEIIQKLTAIKMPWSVNSMAIQAGMYVMKNYEHLLFDIDDLMKRSKDFQSELKEVSWLRVHQSDTNYVLLEMLKSTSATLKDYLVTDHGILIRDANNFRGLSGEHIRLAVQDLKANSQLMKALYSWNP